MIRLEIKNYNMILTEKPKKPQCNLEKALEEQTKTIEYCRKIIEALKVLKPTEQNQQLKMQFLKII